ncbi:DUF6308 family protein [Amycolatopsis australiensis]|uniref:Uncharacterized protein n=1 Tax=Amycolatopsis australiensis TaxID=546364 RepID=A0A1K1QVE2_9PSEU|nr:DUF6308 family protein [Amycolatopsis australiensis]SFW63930.1 hypothetical protein SAMN04489730_2305 [Amycolatopsis australiensis]
MNDYAHQHRLLDDCVRGVHRQESLSALRRYFGEERTRYTGRWFERFAGGGDRPDIANTVTEADVLALNFLSITSLADVAIDTTMTYAYQIRGLLEQIPANLPMHATAWSAYERDAPAHRLWNLFRRCGGSHRPVTASKLMARKRPRLIPVYDSRVRAVLRAPHSEWHCLWSWFHTDPTRIAAVEALRTEAGGIEDISLLRCLDVVLWMRAGVTR